MAADEHGQALNRQLAITFNKNMAMLHAVEVELFANRVYANAAKTYKLLKRTAELLTSKDITPEKVTDIVHDIEDLLVFISHGHICSQQEIDIAVENFKIPLDIAKESDTLPVNPTDAGEGGNG